MTIRLRLWRALSYGLVPGLALALCSGCAGPREPGPSVVTLAADPQPYAAGSQPRPGAPRPTAPAPDSTASGAESWPDTPLTPFARDMTALALAALEGRELPADPPIPLGAAAGQPRVSSEGAGLAPPLRVLCFFVQVEASFAQAPPGTPGGTLELGFALCASGVRLVELDPDPARPSRVLPPRLEGLGRAAREAIAAIAAGRGEEYLIGERDREALGGEPLYSLALRESLRADQLVEVQRRLAQLGEPTGYFVDDLGVVGVDQQGPIMLALDVDRGPNGELALDGPPLVRVRRLSR